jgi:hypothetical protein
MDRDTEIGQLRQRLAELEAQQAAEAQPPGQALLAAKPRKASKPAGWQILGAVVVVFIIGVALSQPAPAPPAATANSANNVDPALVKLGAENPLLAKSSAAASTPKANWVYDTYKDPMSDVPSRTACTTSTNQVHLGAPYGSMNGTLCIRRTANGTDVYVRINDDGQILCRSYEACTIHVRFDEQPARSASAVGPSDNSTETVFFQNKSRIIADIKASKLTRIELPFYQAGEQTLEFPTDGLEWPPNAEASAK